MEKDFIRMPFFGKEPVSATGANDTTELKGSVVLDARGVPGPGEECPLCGEKTPNEHALEMRRWRARKKNA